MLERTTSTLRDFVDRLRPGASDGPPPADGTTRTLDPGVLTALGLKQQPFRDQATAEELFADDAIEMNLNMLTEQMRTGAMLPVLKGEPGSGKTSLLIQLMARAQDECQFFVCRAEQGLTAERIITDMLRLLTRPVPHDTAECFRELARRLRTTASDEQPAALVIDDAHVLSDRELGHVLTAYDSLRKALQGRFRLLLAADPALELRLPQLQSDQIDAGQVFAANVRPLARARIGPYLHWRLRVAGARHSDMPFDEDLLDRIAAASEALPRSIEAAATAELNARWGNGA